MTAFIELKKPHDVPDGREYIYSAVSFDHAIKRHEEMTGRTPEVVYHWKSVLGNWEWYKVVEEE